MDWKFSETISNQVIKTGNILPNIIEGIHGEFNPWSVGDASVFLRYFCPECDFRCGIFGFFLLSFTQNARKIYLVCLNLYIFERNVFTFQYKNEKKCLKGFFCIIVNFVILKSKVDTLPSKNKTN